jgi:hypothetical protein
MKNLAGFLKIRPGFRPNPTLEPIRRRTPKRNRDRNERARHLARLRKRLKKLYRRFGPDHRLTQHTQLAYRIAELRYTGEI